MTTSIAADRDPAEGPLGTFWRVDVANDVTVTAIGNPVFLADAPPPAKVRGAVPTVAPVIPNFPVAAAAAPAAPAAPAHGASRGTSGVLIAALVAAAVLVLATGGYVVTRRRRA
jgi:hypothetical protein